jgi:hypothetical protein
MQLASRISSAGGAPTYWPWRPAGLPPAGRLLSSSSRPNKGDSQQFCRDMTKSMGLPRSSDVFAR